MRGAACCAPFRRDVFHSLKGRDLLSISESAFKKSKCPKEGGYRDLAMIRVMSSCCSRGLNL